MPSRLYARLCHAFLVEILYPASCDYLSRLVKTAGFSYAGYHLWHHTRNVKKIPKAYVYVSYLNIHELAVICL